MWPRTIPILFLACAASLAQVGTGSAAKPTPSVNNLCFVDGLKYSTIESAVSACSGTGIVVIPPTYAGTDSPENGNGIPVWDFRHSQRPDGFTPVTNFGAKGDAATGADGASEMGSTTFTAASGSFASGRDEGKAVIITGAGVDNASFTSTIKAVESSNRVTLATAAGFTAAGLTYWYGTENTPAFRAAYDSMKPLFLPAGKFLMTGTVKGTTPLVLTGLGERSTIIDDGAVFYIRGSGGNLINNFRMQAATKLTPVTPRGFPTPYAGTPVALDRIGEGIGYQPELQDFDVWPKVSKQQQSQQIGPTILAVSDGTHIYRITGDLISILLYDVQFSEVALCDFRAGKNFVAGIALWHTPHDGLMNRHDTIHDNYVRYASYNGIVWAGSEDISILHNRTENNGESGLKNSATRGDGTYDTQVQVIGNQTQHNHYDGLDLSEDYPHKGEHLASSVVSGNTSNFNDRTGTYADGLGWTLMDNTFEGNGLSGMSFDISDSIIAGNILENNNTLHERFSHQMLIGTSTASRNNTIEHNRIVGSVASGAAILCSAKSTGNKFNDNAATGGALFDLRAAPAESSGNSDSNGPYPDKR
jgi:Right handed beta helix region